MGSFTEKYKSYLQKKIIKDITGDSWVDKRIECFLIDKGQSFSYVVSGLLDRITVAVHLFDLDSDLIQILLEAYPIIRVRGGNLSQVSMGYPCPKRLWTGWVL